MNRKMKTMLVTVVVAVLAAQAGQAGNNAPTREVPLGGEGYVIHVPSLWQCETVDQEGITVHFRALPVQKVYGHFSVYLLDRGTASPAAWIDYHLDKNMPAVHGACTVDSNMSCSAGPFPARSISATHLKGRMGYGLMETLIFTEHHVVILSYLYDLTTADRAKQDMDRITASFRTDPKAGARARHWYAEDRTLGLEKFGLFLRLPQGWQPAGKGRQSGVYRVSLPSGGAMEIHTFKRISSGMKGLKQMMDKRMTKRDRKNECTFALHGAGGYALVLDSGDPGEKAMLEKVAARALCMKPGEASAMRRKALAEFKCATKKGDTLQAMTALGALELFSQSESTAKTIAEGLKTKEEQIQVACALSLGRMGARSADKALRKMLSRTGISERVKMACLDSCRTTVTSQQ